MKIGINTLQVARNYGAMLQAYALKTYLEHKGHDVYMINNRFRPNTKWNPKSFSKCSLREKILYFKYICKWYLPPYFYKKLREYNFDSFRTHYFDMPFQDGFDVIIYGSDQIWSKWKNKGYDPFFWGKDGLTTKRRIAFSASMGVVDIEESDRKFIFEALSHFDAVSVREEDLRQILINGNYAPHLTIKKTLDPVFLLIEEWNKLASKRLVRKPYLLFYDFQVNEETTYLVKYIAKEKNLQIVRITDGVVSVEKNKYYFRTAGPKEFLSLIKYADFVFTSSFHGAAFSIIFEKQFYVRQVWNTERVKTLLDSGGISDRFINSVEDVDLQKNIDYSKVNDKIMQFRVASQKFLIESLAK